MTDSPKTDWSSYYGNPFPAARFTRRITACRALSLLKSAGIHPNPDVLELGGGGSSFFPAFDRAFHPHDYKAVDNCIEGLRLFLKQNILNDNVSVLSCDLLAPPPVLQADVVLSFGLIEHFSPQDTPVVIQRHFRFAKPGAIVLITFPSPCFPYPLVRTTAELFRIWQFPDERPLRLSEVASVCAQFGTVLKTGLNRSILLTQGYVLARKNECRV